MKKFIFLFLFLFALILTPQTFAQSNAYVSIVNPVRGSDFWEAQNQNPETAVLGQIAILKQLNLPATWLIRFDALGNKNIIDVLKNRPSDEKGLFLEVTPTWASQAEVEYRASDSWHSAGSAFLTGYEREDREKLIDVSFEKFKSSFGWYPSSVGAWWIDSYSLDYMQKKYGIISGLIVADQYTTDNYQIWGQYFGAPYYPDNKNALHPAQSLQNKIPVVLSQWAARDPLNGYGNGVFESTFSVQPNDYIDYHSLGTDYFTKLINIYTQQEFNQFGSVVVGLENTYDWSKYGEEYKSQLEVLARKRQNGQLNIVTLEDFSFWYQKTFPQLSPEHIIIADDPLGSIKKVVWFMNPYFRAGWFYTVSNGASSAYSSDGSVFRDIRQYVEGDEELCFQKSCSEVNFATFATRVLDEVSFGHKWVIDEGKISDFKVSKIGEKFIISYSNEAGKNRIIEFLPRDIGVDGKISSIDKAILEAIKQDTTEQKKPSEFKKGQFNWTIFGIFSKVTKFLLFLLIVCLIPGLILINKQLKENEPVLKRVFLALIVGSVLLTLLFYVTSILNLRPLIYLYVLLSLLLFLRLQQVNLLKMRIPKTIDKLSLASILIIAAGTIFQNIPTFKNGLVYPFGMGFWGPNTHDGIWHISLVSQLLQGIPVENPILAGAVLKNYHFFYDLLIAAATFFTKIPIIDLVFRFFPLLFSLLLGIGTYYLITNLFSSRLGIKNTKIAAIFSLCFVYFAGSFGWIPEYLKGQGLGGESAFWANQAISFNLNPPFAISVLIIIAFLFFVINKSSSWKEILLSAMLAGSLMGFKSYGAVLVISSLFFVSVINAFKKQFSYTLILIFSIFLSVLIFLSNFQQNTQLIIFSPFWLIHSMIDSPDRVGWTRLSLARTAGLETRNWFKFISAEVLSLLIFVIGNLGLRVLSFVSFVKIRRIVKDPVFLFIFLFSLLSFLIPILFIQSGNPWNTIQFSYYGLYTAALVSGPALVYMILRLPRMLLFLIIPLVLVLMPINSITTATYYLGYLPHGRIDAKELEALEFLSKQTDGVVLTYPYDKKLKDRIAEPWPLFAYDSTAYVAALSGKAVFLEDEGQNQILLTDYKKRLVASKDFFLKPVSEDVKFLRDNNIKYIYLPKIYNVSLDESGEKVENIFKNEEVVIYKVK